MINTFNVVFYLCNRKGVAFTRKYYNMSRVGFDRYAAYYTKKYDHCVWDTVEI